MPITPEHWLASLIEVFDQIADKEHQERRWLAPDAYAWECPEELINCVDDVVFDGFVEQFAATFSQEQRRAAFDLKNELKAYCDATPRRRKAAEVLSDERWDAIRQRAAEFIKAFRDKWPVLPIAGSAEMP